MGSPSARKMFARKCWGIVLNAFDHGLKRSLQ